MFSIVKKKKMVRFTSVYSIWELPEPRHRWCFRQRLDNKMYYMYLMHMLVFGVGSWIIFSG